MNVADAIIRGVVTLITMALGGIAWFVWGMHVTMTKDGHARDLAIQALQIERTQHIQALEFKMDSLEELLKKRR